MLTQLRIQKFKAWQDTGIIRMAPITLFFGANSSGKSSIGQFLMMLKQTVESPDRKAVLYPGDQNTPVQLGSYQAMVFHGKPENKISFSYRWSLDEGLQVKDFTSRSIFSGNTLSFEAEVGLRDKSRHSLAVESFKYSLSEEDKIKLSVGMEWKTGPKPSYKATSEHYVLKRNQMRAWPLGAPIRFYGFPDEMVAYYQNAAFVQDFNLRHENLFRLLSYLGPLRSKTDRLYSWSGNKPENVGYSGDQTIAALLAARDRRINLKYKQRTKTFDELIAYQLKRMKLIDDFKIESISDEAKAYEVKVRTKGSKDWVDLPDVGFGISQVLPVLVQCFYAPRGSIILMEQPEIHLHPSAQAELADVMIDAIRSGENGQPRNVQLIIETHSEHFLRRLQRRIAEGVLPQEDISAYFANADRTPAKLENLQIDDYGNILNWPKDFFGDEMGDITAQAKAALKNRINQKARRSGAPQ